jgi:lipopolysaccharide transport system permease protein
MFRALIEQKWLLRKLVLTDIKAKYVGSFLGLFWSVINPLLLMAMYIVIFSVVLKIKVGTGERSHIVDFGAFLFCGMLPWMGISEALQRSSHVLIDNSGLIRKMNFPLALLPAHLVLSALLNELVAMGLFVIFLIIFIAPPGIWALGVLALIPFQVALTLGLSFLVAGMNVFYRDMAQITGATLTIWFFGTPIVYPIDNVPPQLKSILDLNPLTPLVEAYRILLLDNTMPPIDGLLYFAGFTITVLLLCSLFFSRKQDEIRDLV